jgi:exonuclease VII large subunit
MQHRHRLSLAALRLSSVNPLASLARGYAYCERDGRPVHAVADLQEGERLRLRFADGAASTLIEKIES